MKLKEDGPTVVQLMAPSFQVCFLTEKSNSGEIRDAHHHHHHTHHHHHQAAKLGAPTKVQMKKASERLSQLMASKPFSRMPYENDFE